MQKGSPFVQGIEGALHPSTPRLRRARQALAVPVRHSQRRRLEESQNKFLIKNKESCVKR